MVGCGGFHAFRLRWPGDGEGTLFADLGMVAADASHLNFG